MIRFDTLLSSNWHQGTVIAEVFAVGDSAAMKYDGRYLREAVNFAIHSDNLWRWTTRRRVTLEMLTISLLVFCLSSELAAEKSDNEKKKIEKNGKKTESSLDVEDKIARKALGKDLIESGDPGERAGREVGTVTLNDGTTYKNAQVVNPTPAGIDVAYTIDGEDHVQFVAFEDLSEETRKKFNYDPEEAEAYREYLSKLESRLRQRRRSEEENREAKSSRDRRMLESIRQRGRKMILRVDRNVGNGVVGWAEPPNSYVTHSDLGDIFVYGYSAPDGAVRLGMLYPTGEYMHGYSAYAPTPAIAYWVATTNTGREFGGF